MITHYFWDLFSRTRYVAFVRHAAYQFQQLQQQSQKKAGENKVCTVSEETDLTFLEACMQ